nr:MAG TPA: hypothetical protein [Caudoviricetes sp.]
MCPAARGENRQPRKPRLASNWQYPATAWKQPEGKSPSLALDPSSSAHAPSPSNQRSLLLHLAYASRSALSLLLS